MECQYHLCIYGQLRYTVDGFDGLLWPGRFIGFGVGMVIYAIFTSHFFNEGITTKTAISLGLCISY